MIDRQSILAITNNELRRIEKRLSRKQQTASRSQYLASVASVDAEQGFIEMALPTGGTANVNSITNTALNNQAAVSLPRYSTVGSADAKPI